MTFDDGQSPSDLTSADDFRARFRAAMEVEGVRSWKELCDAAEVDPAKAQRAIELGSRGLPETTELLSRLAMVLGRDINWVITGTVPQSIDFRKHIEESVIKLVREFIYKRNVPRSQRQILLDEALRKVRSLRCHTMQGAFRVGVPRTWLHIADIYDRLFDPS